MKLIGSTSAIYSARLKLLAICRDCNKLPPEEQRERGEKAAAKERRRRKRRKRSVWVSGQAGAPGLGKRR
jgi:hypothetical protein